MATIGTLVVDLLANTAKFNANLEKSARKMRSFANRAARQMRRVRRAIAGMAASMKGMMFAVIALAGPAVLGLLVRSSFKTIDALAKVGDKLGITTKMLAGLQHAATLTAGVTEQAFNKGLQNMIRTIRDANNGLMTYKRSYEDLGLNVKKLAQLNPAEQFLEISRAIGNVKNNTKRLGIAYDIFGAKQAALLNTLRQGPKAIMAMVKEAEDLNIAMSRFDAKQIEDANDAFSKAKKAVMGVANSIAIALAPLITDMSNRFVKAAVSARGFRNEALEMVNTVGTGLAWIGNVIRGIKIFFTSMADALVLNILTIQAVLGTLAMSVLELERITGKVPDRVVSAAKAMVETGRVAVGAITDLKKKMDERLNEPLPTQSFKAWIKEMRDSVEKNRDLFDPSKLFATGDGGSGGASTTATAQKAAERFETIRNSLLSEEQLEIESFQRKTEYLVQWWDGRTSRETEFMDTQTALVAQHEAKMVDIKKRAEWQAAKNSKKFNLMKFKAATGMALQELSAFTGTSKKMFKLHKKLSLAMAIVSLPSAVMQAIENGGGLPWGAIPGAITAAAGLAQINAIRSSSFDGGGGGGGSVPSGGGGGSAVPVTNIGGGSPVFQPTEEERISMASRTGSATVDPEKRQVILEIDGKMLGKVIADLAADGRLEIPQSAVTT